MKKKRNNAYQKIKKQAVKSAEVYQLAVDKKFLDAMSK